MAETVRLLVDGVEYQVPKGMNLVDAAKQYAGNDIPVFCYHPKMAPVGMCRMCLVEQGQAQINKETNTFDLGEDGQPVVKWLPKLQTGCTANVVDGMAIRTATQQVTEARDDIIEFLLTSHPLDCPICDKGGECPLQNLTMRHGAGESRFVLDDKIHMDKHYPLGDLIYLDRERCIQCARCTRFQDEVVGDAVLGFHERGRQLQIVTTSTPEFDTYFSGNTTDICPVGALTSADFRFSARPWELTEVPSICTHCPVGCNISATTRQDREAGGKPIIKRIMPRQNEGVNEIWICDKGRFGHHHSRSTDRITTPMIRKNGELTPATWEEAMTLVAQTLKNSDSVGAVAGPFLSNEDLWELKRLVDGVGGNTRLGVYPYRMTGGDLINKVGLASGSNFKDMGKNTTILVVASDLEEEAPVWYLRVKGAADRGARVVTLNGRRTEMDRWARQRVKYTYGNEIAALNELVLGESENLVIIVGGEGLDRAGHGRLMQAAAQLLVNTNHIGRANNGLLSVWVGPNMQGAFDLGYTAESTESILTDRPDVMIFADADVMGDALTATALKSTQKTGFSIVVSMFVTDTVLDADVVLPRLSFAEREGTFTNGERHIQRFYTAQAPIEGPRPDWKIFAELSRMVSGTKVKLSAAAVMQELSNSVPRYNGFTYPALSKFVKQYPDVGGDDLYYGGTAYNNEGGIGLQTKADAESGSVDISGAIGEPIRTGEGDLLIVPVTTLYDRQPIFAASAHLIGEHIDPSHIRINADEAAARGLIEGEMADLQYAGLTAEVVVRIDPSIPTGTVVFPRHLSNVASPEVPVVGSLQKVEVFAHVSG